ncbi:hypothetical protein B0O80DRAFT_502387 [Mortierella sp. GBAus27b]|nr:hypothetical protein B0O80DRAFT_502387 [Mortierella sp. GBAus27b]
MFARRFADVQALMAAGMKVSQRFLALEYRQLKQYAATSSLLRDSRIRRRGLTDDSKTKTSSSTVIAIALRAVPSASTITVNSSLQGEAPTVTGTWIDQIFSSMPLGETAPSSPPSSSPSVSISSTVPSGAQVTEADEPSLLDPSFLATPAAHGHKRPTVTTVTPRKPTS